MSLFFGMVPFNFINLIFETKVGSFCSTGKVVGDFSLAYGISHNPRGIMIGFVVSRLLTNRLRIYRHVKGAKA